MEQKYILAVQKYSEADDCWYLKILSSQFDMDAIKEHKAKIEQIGGDEVFVIPHFMLSDI